MIFLGFVCNKLWRLLFRFKHCNSNNKFVEIKKTSFENLFLQEMLLTILEKEFNVRWTLEIFIPQNRDISEIAEHATKRFIVV